MIPSYSNKVTSSLYGVDINAKRDEPILGKGRYRQNGQMIDKPVFKFCELLEIFTVKVDKSAVYNINLTMPKYKLYDKQVVSRNL